MLVLNTCHGLGSGLNRSTDAADRGKFGICTGFSTNREPASIRIGYIGVQWGRRLSWMPQRPSVRVHRLAYNVSNFLTQLPDFLSKFGRLIPTSLQLLCCPITVILKSSDVFVLSLVFGNSCIILA